MGRERNSLVRRGGDRIEALQQVKNAIYLERCVNQRYTLFELLNRMNLRLLLVFLANYGQSVPGLQFLLLKKMKVAVTATQKSKVLLLRTYALLKFFMIICMVLTTSKLAIGHTYCS